MGTTPLLLLVLGLFAAVATLPNLARGQCVPVTGLSFCSSVNYSVNASSFANPGSSPQEQDHLVQAWYEKNAPDQLQTQDCLEAWKAYLCSFYFPKVQDYMATCYGGSLFVNDTDSSSLCTPYNLTSLHDTDRAGVVTKVAPPARAYKEAPPLFRCQLVPATYASFCRPSWSVASAPNDYIDVWTRMDNVTQLRWSTYASAGVTDACKESLRVYFCAEYFAPCNGAASVSDPLTQVLLPLCTRLQNDCPAGMVRKLCSFNPYDPPDPRECLGTSSPTR